MTDDPVAVALAAHRAGRLDTAEAGYRTAMAAGNQSAAVPLATLFLQQGRFAEACTLLEPLAELLPGDPQLAINTSIALRRCERNTEALEHGRRAVRLMPASAAAWNALGLAALELREYGEALEAFETALRHAPRQAALRLHRGHALRRLGRLEQAQADYMVVVQAMPGLLEGWRALATTQGLRGQADAALHSRERALRLAPKNSEVQLEHAVARIHAGQPASAARAIAALVAGERSDDPQAWYWLGDARKRIGDAEGARDAFAEAWKLDPDNPQIAHFHAAAQGELPEHVESGYIRTLFDDFAGHFEQTLTGSLKYETPGRIATFLRRHAAGEADRVLDLGCGTGLMGAALAGPGRHITGVDLSPRMLAEARAKGCYAELHEAEALAFLEGSDQRWDLVVAADVFVYVAALAPVFAAARTRLEPGGGFVFSIECSDTGATELHPVTGRYRHDGDLLAMELAVAGFTDIEREPCVLRLEMGKEVRGELLLARAPA